MTTKHALRTYDAIWRPYAFDETEARVIFSDGHEEMIWIQGIVFSEFNSGPNLSELAAFISSQRDGVQWVSLAQCHPLGWRIGP